MTQTAVASRRGRIWFDALTNDVDHVETGLRSVLVADATLGGERVRVLSVVPDPNNRFPRARHGELGLDEGWALARHVREAIEADRAGTKRPILAIVDVKSQAYGRLEELLGISWACAAATDAYATARLAGHPVISLIVGSAMSGGFLAHGYQAHRLLAFDNPGVQVQAMGKESAARITLRSVQELDELGAQVTPMAYDIRSFAKLGLVHELIGDVDPDAPSQEQIAHVAEHIIEAITDVRRDPGDLTTRLENPQARATRAASLEVRRRMAEQWNRSARTT